MYRYFQVFLLLCMYTSILYHVFHQFHQFHPMLSCPYSSLSMDYHPLSQCFNGIKPTSCPPEGANCKWQNADGETCKIRCVCICFIQIGETVYSTHPRSIVSALSASKILIPPPRGLASALSWVPWKSLRDVHGCHSPGLQDQRLLEQHKQREMGDSSSIFVTTEVMIIIIMQIDGDAFMIFRIEVFMFLIMIRFHVESTLACENHMLGRYPRVLSALP